jgi:alkylated DNA repair protein alkB family protein 7
LHYLDDSRWLPHHILEQAHAYLPFSRRYEKGHWDAVITLYKEIELPDNSFDSPEIPELFQRVRSHLASQVPPECTWLPCHAIDLKQDGELTAHVDSIKFSGGLVAGISLLTPSIMRLIPDQQTAEQAGWVDIYLPPLSLYVLTGVGRYSYTHELLPSGATFESNTNTGNQITVERGHRLSVIFRDAKTEKDE